MTNNNLFSEQKTTSPGTLHHKPFAEVVTSSLDRYTAQCWQWDHLPNFGSLVQVVSQNITIIGCVTQVQTGSLDPMRTPVAYKKTEDELKTEQPQIFEFLTTTFDVQVIGYHENKNQIIPQFLYMIPPTPSKIHTFVQECPSNIAMHFLADPSFLNLLFAFQNNLLNLDELLLALVQKQAASGTLNQERFTKFCETFSLLNGNDYRRLKLFLKRVEQLVR